MVSTASSISEEFSALTEELFNIAKSELELTHSFTNIVKELSDTGVKLQQSVDAFN